MLKKTSNKIIASIAVLLIAVGGYYFAFGKTPANGDVNENRIKATVYKSPTCSCCLSHTGYLKGQGFDVKTMVEKDTNLIKQKRKNQILTGLPYPTCQQGHLECLVLKERNL